MRSRKQRETRRSAPRDPSQSTRKAVRVTAGQRLVLKPFSSSLELSCSFHVFLNVRCSTLQLVQLSHGVPLLSAAFADLRRPSLSLPPPFNLVQPTHNVSPSPHPNLNNHPPTRPSFPLPINFLHSLFFFTRHHHSFPNLFHPFILFPHHHNNTLR